jgi:hypothetical protein
MRRTKRILTFAAACAISLSGIQTASAYKTNGYVSSTELLNDPINLFAANDRPDGCPPCFNCNLDDFVCHQFANCSQANGRCSCPPGFGGNDCSDPTCGSLADGRDRSPRKGKECDCKEGWDGINCNVCRTNEACVSMVADEEGAVCYRDGLVVKENYQQCNITNKKILEQLKGQIPQATFSCNAPDKTCNFQCEYDRTMGVLGY